MAISWGAWEYSGGNGMRVGLDVSWEAISHTETVATCTIKVYTENQYDYGDTQTLSYGGSIGGSTTFSNNSSGGAVLRATKTYDYTYPSSSYGSSPGSRTFSASLSGAYNGVTPSKSVTSNIPARPIAAPAAPSSVSFSRVSDTSTKVSWANNATSGEPYETLTLQRSVNGGSWVTVSSSIGGTTTSYTNGTAANWRIDYQVRANNDAGSSGYASSSSYIFTTPDAPTSPLRTGPSAGAGDQVVSWTNEAGYSEYNTEVWGADNGNWALRATVGSGATSWTHTAPDPTKKWKYKVRHKTTTGTQGTLYSAYSAETTETAGQTTPPLAPTNLQPKGIQVDPTLPQSLAWTFNPGQAGDTQTNREVQHRLAGATSWTTTGKVASASTSYSLPANTYLDGQTVEWQVRTWGADPVESPWSELATFTTVVTPLPADPVKVPLQLDLFTGQVEASTSGREQSDYVMRVQSNLIGGGIKYVDSTTVSWSKRFIPIGIGRGPNTFPNGHHDINNPFSWTVTNKVLTNNFATLTVSASTMRMRAGESITVTGVGAPFDGTWVVRSTESNKVSFDCTNADVASASSSGTVGPVVKGHGGAADRIPAITTNRITVATWEVLWYELPFGWGSGSTPRKNGVVAVTNKELVSNVAKLTLVAPHYFAVGDRVKIAIGDAVFDSSEVTLTAVTTNTISWAKTNSNVNSAPASGLVTPSGKDTFFGNFHVTYYTADFAVPPNWVLLAVRNGDDIQIEWGTGDKDTGWIAPSLTNSWANYGSVYANAAYMRRNGIVHLRGMVKDGTDNAAIFTLPAGFRPANTHIFVGMGIQVNETTGAASAGTAHTHPIPIGPAAYRIDVNNAGGVIKNESIGANGWISLANISFEAEL